MRWQGSNFTGTQILSKNSTYVIGQADFTNAAAGDFSLKANSPFINKGVNIGYISDLRGVSLSHPPDIGAYEYVSPN